MSAGPENILVIDHDIMHNDAMRRQSRNGKRHEPEMDVFIHSEGDSIHEDMSQKSQLRTTEQVADYFGVKPRTIQLWVAKGWLVPKKIHRPEGVSGGVINVFDEKQVDRLMQARANAKMQVIPADTTHSIVAPANKMDREEMMKMLSVMSQQSGKAPQENLDDEQPKLPWRERLYLNTDEAMAYTGLGRVYLEKSGKGKPIGPRQRLMFRRSELDKL
jgi:DNA-binding transcriptional MerR regulator